MKLPTEKECFEILKENKTPSNIVEHCKAVNKVAVFLAKKLKENGVEIDIELVDRASLLHDLDRADSKDHNHGYITESILAKKGYPELGKAIVGHRFTKVLEKNMSWEEKVVNYADKRVRHRQVVSLKQRFEDLVKRHMLSQEQRSPEAEKAFFDLEKDIFGKINMNPDDLRKHIR